VLEYDRWRITLDGIKDGNTDELKRTGGFSLTHVGAIERVDNVVFAIDDCQELLKCLGYFLSFCRGAWTQPILLSAEDANAVVVGRRWHTVELDRFKSTFSWVPSTEPVYQHLYQAFAGYAGAWFDPKWADAIRIGTQWHVEASTGAAEKSVILLQAALELCAWTQLVEVTKRLTKDQWTSRQYPFSEKLRLLLAESGIPVNISPELPGLQAYCAAAGLKHGPEAVTSVRNALVHPNPAKRNRLNAHSGVLIDAWFLASWYLDLCILKICGYTSRYSDRTARGKWKGDEVSTVPWV
jgi:hypothetical protein